MISITPPIFNAQLKKVPYATRVFLLGPDLEEAVANLSRHYNLPQAAAARVADILTGILLNLVPPAQVEAELTELGLSKESADAAIQEMNDRIFAPLQKQAREQAEAEKVAAEEAATAVPNDVVAGPDAEPPPPARPAVLPPPALVAPRIELLRPSTPPVQTPPAPVAPITPNPTLQPIAPVAMPAAAPVSIPVPPQTQLPMRTMAHDVEAMKGGSPASAAMQVAPATAPPPVSLPIAPAPVAAPLPKEWAAPVTPPNDVPAFDKTPNISAPRIPAPDKKEVVSTLQKYGIDPYREVPE